jgi:hypothetical protein
MHTFIADKADEPEQQVTASSSEFVAAALVRHSVSCGRFTPAAERTTGIFTLCVPLPRPRWFFLPFSVQCENSAKFDVGNFAIHFVDAHNRTMAGPLNVSVSPREG